MLICRTVNKKGMYGDMSLINNLRFRFLAFSAKEYSLQYWRDRILFSIYLSVSIFGFIAYIPSALASVYHDMWSVFIVDTAVYGIFITVFLLRHLSYNFKAWTMLLICYLLGCILIIEIGPVGAGYMYLFAFSALSALLLGKKQAIFALTVSLITIAIFIILDEYNALYINLKSEYNLNTWIVNAANFIFLNSMITISLIVLVSGLHQYATNEKRISGELEKDREKLKTAVKQLNREIIEKGQSQKRLEEAGNKLQAIIEKAGDGILFLDGEGIIFESNKALCRMLRYRQKEIVNRSIFNFLKPEDKSEFEIIIEKGPSNYTEIFETELIGKDNIKTAVEFNTKLIEQDTGPFYICIVRDLTERKKVEEKILNLNAELEERVAERTAQLEETLGKLKIENSERKKTEDKLKKAKSEVLNSLEKEKELNDLKSRFISMISHEYRTPLTVILSSTYILEQLEHTQKNEKYKVHLSRIQSSVTSMTKFLEEVLILGKKDFELVEDNIIEFDFVDFSRDIVNNFKSKNTKKQIFDFTSNREQILFKSDSGIIKQIFESLLINAVMYSPENSMIKLDVEDLTNEIQIVVYDNGMGIPEEDQKLIFEPFHRGVNSGFIPGTGLGLAIVKRYIDSLKGRIFVNSQANVGSTFTVILPKK